MEKITQVTEADIGRIAVSQDGDFRVEILSCVPGRSHYVEVKFLEGSKYGNGRRIGSISKYFSLIGGAEDMYWEEPKALKGVWLETAPAIKMYGEEAVNEVLRQAWQAAKKSTCWKSFEHYMESFGDCHINKGECVGIDSEGMFDGWNKEVILKAGEEILSFEEFKGRLGISSGSEKQKVAKPRFHKPRKKPPVRQKTDVVVHYKTGEKYTVKNVSLLTVSTHVEITSGEKVEKGISVETTSIISLDLVRELVAKTPTGLEIIDAVSDGNFMFTSDHIYFYGSRIDRVY